MTGTISSIPTKLVIMELASENLCLAVQVEKLEHQLEVQSTTFQNTLATLPACCLAEIDTKLSHINCLVSQLQLCHPGLQELISLQTELHRQVAEARRMVQGPEKAGAK